MKCGRLFRSAPLFYSGDLHSYVRMSLQLFHRLQIEVTITSYVASMLEHKLHHVFTSPVLGDHLHYSLLDQHAFVSVDAELPNESSHAEAERSSCSEWIHVSFTAFI